MARRTATLQRLGADDVDALLAAAPEAEAPADGQGDAAAPRETVLLLFDRGTADDARAARVLGDLAADHRGWVRAAACSADELLPRLQQWQDGRRSYDTFDFRRWPAVGVIRDHRLVTTFHPRRVFFDEKLQQREEKEQLEIFLTKMVYYDPAQVKEQKSLELEAGR